MPDYNKILVTGGAGFIGSALIRYLLANNGLTIINVDKLTYAGNLHSLNSALDHPGHVFVQADIADNNTIKSIFKKYQPDAVIHLAAESHVDRSIDGSADFIQTNIVGTYTLLEAARAYWLKLGFDKRELFKFVHVSTDEVFGSLGVDGFFSEATPYNPSSPYSASKASSDHLVRAWRQTFGLPTLITNCSNNYGPFQFPEKLVPLTILNALEGKSLPVYGHGENIRDWLYVDDHVRAMVLVLEKGKPGQSYNIGGHNERSNLEVVMTICRILDELRPHPDHIHYEDLITFVQDRPGHDFRYAIDPNKIYSELGWKPTESFESGIRKTVFWYLQNLNWCKSVQDGSYHRERLGLGVPKE